MSESKNRPSAPLPTIRRLPAYLRFLRQAQSERREVISATHIARELELESIQVRKDLAFTGVVGRPRLGFEVGALITGIEAFLNWDNLSDAFLIGAGNLGRALLGYDGFRRHGLNIVAAFDVDPGLVGTTAHGKEVLPLAKLTELVRRMHIHLAVLAVPAVDAQTLCDELVAAGVVGIWNFTPARLRVPAGVIVQDEDLSAGLAVLSVRVADEVRLRARCDAGGTVSRTDGRERLK